MASDLERGFPDGVRLLELAELRDAGLIVNAVLAGLDLRDEAATEPVTLLHSYLADKELLLVLDNFGTFSTRLRGWSQIPEGGAWCAGARDESRAPPVRLTHPCGSQAAATPDVQNSHAGKQRARSDPSQGTR